VIHEKSDAVTIGVLAEEMGAAEPEKTRLRVEGSRRGQGKGRQAEGVLFVRKANARTAEGEMMS